MTQQACIKSVICKTTCALGTVGCYVTHSAEEVTAYSKEKRELYKISTEELKGMDLNCPPEKKAGTVTHKPPIGVIPRKLWIENRERELMRAIREYMEDDIVTHWHTIQEWLGELHGIESAERNRDVK